MCFWKKCPLAQSLLIFLKNGGIVVIFNLMPLVFDSGSYFLRFMITTCFGEMPGSQPSGISKNWALVR